MGLDRRIDTRFGAIFHPVGADGDCPDDGLRDGAQHRPDVGADRAVGATEHGLEAPDEQHQGNET